MQFETWLLMLLFTLFTLFTLLAYLNYISRNPSCSMQHASWDKGK